MNFPSLAPPNKKQYLYSLSSLSRGKSKSLNDRKRREGKQATHHRHLIYRLSFDGNNNNLRFVLAAVGPAAHKEV